VGHAVLHLVSAVNEEAVRLAASGGSQSSLAPTHTNSRLYNLDQMSDEEDEEGEEYDPMASVPPSLLSSPPRGVTGQITADFFRQAMQTAMSSAVTNPSGSQASTSAPMSGSIQQQTPGATEAQLQQLRDMGITDEAVARRALEMTGGDIQLALEFIFGDDVMD